MNVAIIGGGAAGYFSAISVVQHHPNAQVWIFEKTQKVLSKVKVSGGGRCNTTHNCLNNRLMSQNYPRGEKFMRKALDEFGVQDTINWFEQQGVELKTESDNRMFPVSNDSQTIVDALSNACTKGGVKIVLGANVRNLLKDGGGISLEVNGERKTFEACVVASGGSPKLDGLAWLQNLGHTIVSPVPSLFTFSIPKNPITKLMGLSVPNAIVRVQQTKLMTQGPLLITHWGLSGPAILKTSAVGAKLLAERNYQFVCMVNWVGLTEDKLRTALDDVWGELKNRNVGNRNPVKLPARLWEYALDKADVEPTKKWGDLIKKAVNRLVNNLCNDQFDVKGKTTFKEEFVTAGGVSFESVTQRTLESKSMPMLFFAGEVLNIDGVTGGFNFQAAWTTGFIAGKLGG